MGFGKYFFIGQSLKHVNEIYSLYEFFIFFWLTLVEMF